MTTQTDKVNITSVEAMDQALDFKVHQDNSEGGLDDYRVHLENFDGPLDLLLHLIRREQIDIHNIPVAQVCESYLSYLSQLSRPNVNIAGEFFVMAATLLQLKSQTLLPVEDVQDESEDPRLPLVAQLLELERFKQSANTIDAKPWLYRELFPRPEGAASDIIPPEALLDGPIEPVGTYELLLCLKVASDRSHRKPIQISVDTTSIRDRVVSVAPLIESGNIVDFSSLLPPSHKRKDVILTFLAVLELARLKFIEISQSEMLGPIYIKAIRPLEELNMGLLEQF